ncbi:putative sushi, von Willebrand factor [Apostichopus japonicus]|uniref:Putative sushi, von Willebrand factor n=1 Tax=Stichopus japonicus TaxID=307972 RepID=A0A2G8JIP2_STIJA|nr:putative sushi, von Willebrand factor [Apostichopus japonicus]
MKQACVEREASCRDVLSSDDTGSIYCNLKALNSLPCLTDNFLCVGCEFVEAPENGNVIYDPENRTVGSTAYFSCSSGYVLSGNAHLECLETKEWNATNDVSCVAECNRDEAQVTALRRTCMKTCVTADDCLRDRLCVCDGVCGLSCIPTTRENYCDVTLVLVDNTVVTLDPATLVFGTVATISCSSGNIPIDGTREIQRSCLGNGDWSDGSLTCIPSDACRNPPEIENASRDVKLYYANGERLLYSCNPGYTSGSNSYLRCVDGNWSEANIRCIAVQCPALNAPIDGGISYYGTDYNDRVEFSCDQGFSLHGESVLTCQGDGTWSSDVPECTGYCQKPREDVMWVFNDSCQGINSQPNKCGLSYLCDDGYFPINQKVIGRVQKEYGKRTPNRYVVQVRILFTQEHGTR